MKALFVFIKTVFHILLWPLVTTCKRCWSEIKFAIAYGKDKFDAQMIRRDHMILSSRARIIEVCIESSFQPLLQLYLLLPTLIHYFECGAYQQIFEKSPAKTFSAISTIQFFSVITSLICLAWSFNFYKVTQKSGALDFSANAAGRICLLVSSFLQITCRLLAFVFLAYCFGPGEFWPMVALLQLHILLMASLHSVTSHQMLKRSSNWIVRLRLLHHCVLNGIANIYLHNCITYLDEKAEADRKKKRQEDKDYEEEKKTTFRRQAIFNVIFIVENILIIAFVRSKIPDEVPSGLLIFLFFGHLFGIMLSMVYYQYLHLWKDTLHQHITYDRLKQIMKQSRDLVTNSKEKDEMFQI